jgi:DNA mismatch repair protein MutL
MNNRIKRLPPAVACQIAAGEVIERPVSVVKELLENALDAGATEINIFIEGAGIQKILIEDNGDGIWAEDLKLAVEPHSTSKIASLNDLYETRTKGFRGEALASIASVSKLSINSKPKEQANAMRLQALEGKLEFLPSIRADGTSIEVSELFYNVPVRRKFLKSNQYEWQHIENFIKRFALSAPTVQFQLYHDSQLILEFPRALSIEEHLYRIRRIWGKRFFEEAQYIEIERSGLKVWGWLGALSEHRSQNDRLWVFLNGRIVQDKLVLHALKQIYMNVLPEGRYPQCVLYLELPSNWVDINVHPAKHEVRFEEPRLIYDFITSSLKAFWQKDINELSLKLNSFSSSITRQGIENNGLLSIATHQDFYICNSDFIIMPVGQNIFYLVDTSKWWQYNIQKNIMHQSTPWKPRLLTMPFMSTISKIKQDECEKIEAKMITWGIDLQFWDSDRLCIRSIPEYLPQFNLREWVKLLASFRCAEDISLNHLVSCCHFSAYDITIEDIKNIINMLMNPVDKEQIEVFAKCLDFKNCMKVFK